MNFNIKLNPKLLLVGLLIAAGVSTYVVKMKDARATVAVSGLTGKYSCVGNRNFAPTIAYLQSSTDVGANFLTILNFDARTTSTIAFLNSNWNQGSVSATTFTADGTFTEAIGPIPGSYQLTQTMRVSGTDFIFKVNILPSNSGNTLFYSASASTDLTPETGVCQKQ
jgi:hypothetical protein